MLIHFLFLIGIYNEKCEVDQELKKNFDHYISSLLIYKYTAKTSDLPIISKKIYKRYFTKGTMADPLDAVKVSRLNYLTIYYIQKSRM